VGVIQEFVEAHEAAVYELARPEDGNATDAVMLGPAIRETFAVMQAAQERGERMSGTPTAPTASASSPALLRWKSATS
jgi:hypothetical protein